MRDKAFRRFQEEKKKNWVKRTFQKFYHNLDSKTIGIRAHTPNPCSGPCCGNQRKVSGDTLQEKRCKDSMLDY